MGIEKPPRWSLGGFSCANYDRFVCQAHYSTVPRWDASDALQYRSATVEKLYYCRHRGRLRTFGRLGGGAMRIADNRHFRRSMATWQDTKKGDTSVRRYTGVPSRTVQTSGNHAISTGQSPRGNAASMLTGHPSRTTDVADSLTPSDVQPLSLFMIQERIWVVNEKERFNQSAIDKFNQEMNEIIKGAAQDVPKRQRSNILFMFTCQSKKRLSVQR